MLMLFELLAILLMQHTLYADYVYITLSNVIALAQIECMGSGKTKIKGKNILSTHT